jgi:hypothetical protein
MTDNGCVTRRWTQEAIDARHSTETGRHDLYAEALHLVGERHDKGDLVDLVTALLDRIAELEAMVEESEARKPLWDEIDALAEKVLALHKGNDDEQR